MKLNEIYTEVSRKADTIGTQINVAETSRVCSLFLQELKERLKVRTAVVPETGEEILVYDTEAANSILDVILKS